MQVRQSMRIANAEMFHGTGNGQSEPIGHELAQVLENTDDAIIVKDLNAVVTYWNRAASSMYGFSAHEAVGQPLRKLHAADLSDADYARILERVRAGIPTAATTERRKKSGEIVRVALKTAPLLNGHGKLVGEITIARDVTALHRSEEALHAAQAALHLKMAGFRDANRNLTREIAARQKTDAEMRRNNKALAATVRQLESFHRDGEALSRMAELLQSCTQRVEAYAIVRETGAQLFPESAGSLFIYRESRDVLEFASSWGNAPPPAATLAPDECWALRLGSPHFVPKKGTIRCRHAHEDVESYVCMPVQGQGQVLGLLHIAVDVDALTTRPARDTEQRLRALTDRVGPALANLKLRDALREMALRDGLTGLYNRRYLEDVLNRELHRAERSEKHPPLRHCLSLRRRRACCGACGGGSGLRPRASRTDAARDSGSQSRAFGAVVAGSDRLVRRRGLSYERNKAGRSAQSGRSGAVSRQGRGTRSGLCVGGSASGRLVIGR
jgi:PAS domain S-box-containing protein